MVTVANLLLIDFDPSQVKRTHAPKTAGNKLMTVRLMAPFPMKCTACGEYIYKGRKFNARKETPSGEKYLNIQIYRFYIRCTRCSGEITFKTDPKNMDYICERGARRNFEAWRPNDQPEESVEERLDRLEEEEAGLLEDRDAMQELETKAKNLKSEEKIADALDAIRIRNAERNRAERGDIQVIQEVDQATIQEEQDKKDADLAKEAFRNKRLHEDVEDVVEMKEKSNDFADAERWKPARKRKRTDRTSLLPGIIRKG